MGQSLLQLLPLALAAALSSVPITATIFILLSESRSRSGLAFLAGTVLGTFAAVVLAAVAGEALPGRPHRHDVILSKLEIAIGIAMVVLGVVTLARRTRTSGGHGAGWLDDIGSFGMLPVFGIGLALNIRPKAVLVVLAAGLAISKADLPFDENLVLLLLYTAIATSTVVVPIVATILFPQRMEPRLLTAKRWIAAHSATVGATIMILIGGFVIGAGMSG
jgi:Sap, sulfolipid-1-addressing protein